MKRAIQKVDLIPDWIRITAAENMVKEPPVSHGFSIIDPFAQGDTTIRKIKAELYKDPESGAGVVQLAWEGTTPPVLEFEKKYASSKEAEAVFSSMLEELRKIESYVEADPAKAKEKVKALFDEYKGKSDKLPSGGSSGGAGSEKSLNSSLHLEIAKGWNILNKEGRLVVDFSESFLSDIFSNYKVAESLPTCPGEFTYITSSRQHCGNDNYVISYWRKTETTDGNIIRNAALVSRVGGESYLLTGVSLENYNLICTALTPDPIHYGISYDSVTGKWYKTAAVVERYFSDPEHPEELDRILDFLGKGKKKPAEDLLAPEKAPKKEEKEEKPSKEEETLPLGGVEETAPLGEGAEQGGSPEEQLAELLKKEASDKK